LSLAVVIVLIVPLGPTAVSASETPIAHPAALLEASVDTAGIPLVTKVVQPSPSSEQEAQDVSDAQVFAENHPDDVGYPWLDSASGSLELSAASARGRGLLEPQLSAFKSAPHIRDVQFSYGKLTAIADGVTRLAEKGVPDSDLIYRTAPDYQSNRVVIWVSGPSTQLFRALAARYGTDAIAVIIDPASRGGSPMTRQNDISPFWGGAKIGTPIGGCSDSFAWIIGGTVGNALLTAGHCAPTGGSISISGTAVGNVTASTEENWTNPGGTQYYSGQSTYRGDVAIIRLKTGFKSDPYIWRGAATASTASKVLTTLRRYSYLNENVYFSGYVSGETGLYHINAVGVNQRYIFNCGSSCYARNIVLAGATTSYDPCTAQGDSGGSIFSPVTGGVRAVGTYSGQAASPCDIVFTDIYNTYLALPGDALLY
jgi:hypothetical protein